MISGKTPIAYQLKEVSLHQITGPLFETRLYRDDRELNTSIQNFGVLNPPRIVLHEGSFKIVDGWVRIEAARKMGKTQLSCLICEGEHSDLAQMFLICLELNRWERVFNLAERAVCFKQAQTFFEGSKIPRHFWAAVGIKEDVRNIHQHKEFLKLPVAVQKYAVDHDIPLPIILGFLRFPPAQIENIATQLFLLPLNRNKLSEILSMLLDITKREGFKPLEILNTFLQTLEGEKNLFKKEERLRGLLMQRSNPSQ